MQASLSPTALRRLREQRTAAARVGINIFTELVLKDEQTGQAVRQADLHRQWHRLLDQHDRLVLWSHVESGKTQAISVARTLHELGKNPGIRIALVSNTFGQASKIVRTIAGYIERSEELHRVFSGLKPATPWTDSAITVARPTRAKDPSIVGYGLHGAVLGSRVDLLIMDDILDYESTRTEEQRRTTWEWVDSTLLSRLSERGRVVCIGTAWHPEDLMHRLSERGWPSLRCPVEKEDSSSAWPERWSPARIAKTRLELGPADAARMLDCLARSDAEARFKLEWIDTALRRGAGKTCLPHLLNPGPCRVVTGCDLAVSKASSADLTAFVTLLIHPNRDRQVLNVESGRWYGPEIVDRLLRIHQRYGGDIIVESVAAQAYISHFLRELGSLPVRDFKTGKGKMSLEWQVESLATEMARGAWVIPSDDGKVNHPEVASFLRDCLYYSPSKHTPDRLAAACFARWGAEQAETKVEWFTMPSRFTTR